MISNFNNYSNFDYYKYNSMFPKQKYRPFENTNDNKNDTINDILTKRKHDIVAESNDVTRQGMDVNHINGLLSTKKVHLPFASFWGLED